MTPVLDLSSLDTGAACDAGVELELLHPVSKAPLGIFIYVLGRDSQAFKSFTRQSVNARLRKDAEARRRGREPEVTTVEAVEQEGVAALVACTRGWRSGDLASIRFQGNDLLFSAENASKLYVALPWIKQQVDEGIGDLENFLKP